MLVAAEEGNADRHTTPLVRHVRFVVAIADVPTRQHFLDLLARDRERLDALGSAHDFSVVDDPLPDGSNPATLAMERLGDHFTSHPADAAILLSDLLTERPAGSSATRCAPAPLARCCYDRFRDRLYATIAVTGHRCRVLDIDRTIGLRPDDDTFIAVVSVAMERLSYLDRPTRVPLTGRITVRTLGRNQIELKRYFELRYRVYSAMGYLTPEAEESPSRMEMDWCDKKSIHIGAFEHDGARQNLIGTARVVTSEPVDGKREKVFYDLAGYDPVLQRQLDMASALGLPVFDSQQGMNELMTQLLTGREKSGELSRVTVAGAYRGIGLSRQLVTHAVAEARRAGLTRLFLECLDIHEPLYGGLGFERVSNLRGRVVGVDRTMIVMQLAPAGMMRPAAAPQESRTI